MAQQSVSSSRPRIEVKDPFVTLKEKFWAFAEQRTRAWDFLPLLHHFVNQLLSNGFYTSTTALLLIFQAVPSLSREFDVGGIVRGGLTELFRYQCFVSTAEIRKTLRAAVDNDHLTPGDYDSIVVISPDKEIVDTVCHRCGRSLSDNAAFYARNDESVGYYYCSRCRLLLDGCALCDVPIRGLAKLITSCGHRLHLGCWDQWLAEDFHECPSGCGQPID